MEIIFSKRFQESCDKASALFFAATGNSYKVDQFARDILEEACLNQLEGAEKEGYISVEASAYDGDTIGPMSIAPISLNLSPKDDIVNWEDFLNYRRTLKRLENA